MIGPLERLGVSDDVPENTIDRFVEIIDKLNELIQAYNEHTHDYTIGFNNDVQTRTTAAVSPTHGEH